jgi:hypothetical protein
LREEEKGLLNGNFGINRRKKKGRSTAVSQDSQNIRSDFTPSISVTEGIDSNITRKGNMVNERWNQ